ncbi:MAG: hypothetical protein ACJ764_00170 [Solirubrobacteraceae bacterium]
MAASAGHQHRTRFSHPTRIDNRFYPLRPGMRFVLVGSAREHGGRVRHREVFIISDATKKIDGVRTVVIWDRDYYRGRLREGELTFQAQGDGGAVWNFGEYPEEFSRGHVTGAPDTWIAGLQRARAGVLMPDRPRLGQPAYRQGWAPSVGFADVAKVHATGLRVCVPAGCYRHVLETEEGDPTDRSSHQFKYYAPGVGNVRVGFSGGGDEERLELVSAGRLSAGDMAEVDRRVLAIDHRGYRVSPHVYGRTLRARVRGRGTGFTG